MPLLVFDIVETDMLEKRWPTANRFEFNINLHSQQRRLLPESWARERERERHELEYKSDSLRAHAHSAAALESCGWDDDLISHASLRRIRLCMRERFAHRPWAHLHTLMWGNAPREKSCVGGRTEGRTRRGSVPRSSMANAHYGQCIA